MTNVLRTTYETNYDTIFDQAKDNEQYSFTMRLRLLKYHRIKEEHKILKHNKESYVHLLFKNWEDEIREWRRILKRSLEPVTQIIIYNKNDWESWTVLYKEPVYFEGTKQELDKELWEDRATKIYADYDCTGRSFTQRFTIAKIGENLWKVAEHFGLDV